jgi:mono/diheme cytochrome c family protein
MCCVAMNGTMRSQKSKAATAFHSATRLANGTAAGKDISGCHLHLAATVGLLLAVTACQTRQPDVSPSPPSASPIGSGAGPLTPSTIRHPAEPAMALPARGSVSMPTNILAWDSLTKRVETQWGDTNVVLAFQVTNIFSNEVSIDMARPSCGCTVVTLPAQPWILEPDTGGELQVKVDLRGKHGQLNKFIYLQTSEGFCLLTLQVVIPALPPDEKLTKRARNMTIALGDRLAIFKNDCAQCHVRPTVGKMGQPLYQTACGICHDVPERASMVPDLHALSRIPTRGYWKQWIVAGQRDTLMPGFAQAEGGPLTPAQIDSLVDYLMDEFPRERPARGAAGLPAGGPR